MLVDRQPTGQVRGDDETFSNYLVAIIWQPDSCVNFRHGIYESQQVAACADADMPSGSRCRA